MKNIYGLFCGILLLSACASDKEKMDGMSAEELYNLAYENLGATKYAKAAEAFEKVETDHPYSQWAVKSKLMGAFAYYKGEKYDDAVMAIDRYLKYHPGNKDVPYALYLKGMCYYDQISSAEKDQGDTAKAADAFARLIALFPDSKYAEDARNKINLTEDYKAGQEMIVGRYYLHEGNYLSALNRFNVVLEEYQNTVQIEEALYRQVEIYAILGLNKYANGYYKILRSNYPDGKWTAKAAAVMKKIGMEDKITPAKSNATVAETEEESKGWFSGWFGSEEDKTSTAKQQVKEEITSAETSAADTEEESKGWFSGWFGSEEDKTSATKQQVKEEITSAETSAADTEEESKGWFSNTWNGLFSSKDELDEAKADADKTINSALSSTEKQTTETPESEEDEELENWFVSTWKGWFKDDKSN